MTWRPPRRIERRRRPGLPLLVVLSLVLVNVAVVAYHGDPRDWVAHAQAGEGHAKVAASPVSATPTSPASDVAAATESAPSPEQASATSEPDLVGPPLAARLDPTVGLRIPGPVQRVDLLRLRSGENAAQALAATGASPQSIDAALASMTSLVDFRRLRPGDQLKARFDGEHNLVSVEIIRGPLEQVRTDLTGESWKASRVDIPTDTVVSLVSGEITSSLWETLVKSGEDPRLVAEIVDIFAWDIDFYSELYPGDSFRLLVEKRYANGQFLDYGRVLVAELKSAGEAHQAFAHADADGSFSYYDTEGRSMRKQLLKSPLKYAHVTSSFGNRVHPILGYNRKHNGIDYGAPIGTPVWAVGDGKVTYAGWKGGYGRYVEVRHANGWTSEYAHLSRLNVRPGQHVSQKQIIAFTGTSGLSTGPHLHYGLKRSGTFVNPLKQKFERGKALAGDELARFRTHAAELVQELERVTVAHETPSHGPQEG